MNALNTLNADTVRRLYEWASSSGLADKVTLLFAERMIFVIPVVAVIAWFWPGKNAQSRRRLLVAVGVSCALNGVVLLILAATVHHPRPFVVLHMTPLFAHGADSSFPSDHELLGMAIAAPLLWSRRPLGYVLAIFALVVGFARVATAVHWPSDILGTALIALVMGAIALPIAPIVIKLIPAPLKRLVGLEPAPVAAAAAGSRR
ncbi:MAG TPA: phosphatase PAP2 family protein [Thermomicrobiaceae bacterium]|nr:phosphatase PAP2 family protein [Thermomicrobiaceae bacterium]